MTGTDPIADMLIRIRNATSAGHESVIMPASKMKVAIATLLKDEGFIKAYQVLKGQPQPMLRLHLAFKENKEPAISGLKRVSKPGLKVYVGKGEIPRVYGGLGVAILSTSHGIMTGKKAWRLGIGGELLCYVW